MKIENLNKNTIKLSDENRLELEKLRLEENETYEDLLTAALKEIDGLVSHVGNCPGCQEGFRSIKQ